MKPTISWGQQGHWPFPFKPVCAANTVWSKNVTLMFKRKKERENIPCIQCWKTAQSALTAVTASSRPQQTGDVRLEPTKLWDQTRWYNDPSCLRFDRPDPRGRSVRPLGRGGMGEEEEEGRLTLSLPKNLRCWCKILPEQSRGEVKLTRNIHFENFARHENSMRNKTSPSYPTGKWGALLPKTSSAVPRGIPGTG